MRNRTRFAVLALAGILAAGVMDAAASAQVIRRRTDPRTAVPPEEPPPSATVPRERSRKRAEQEIRVNEEDFSGVPSGRPVRAQGRQVRLGQAVRGELDRNDEPAGDGSYYEEWFHRGRPGTRVSVNLSSDAFDTFLLWGRMVDGEFQALAADDDGGEDTDSRLTVWIRDDLEYVVRANSYEGGQTGRYTLLVEEASARPDPATPRGTIAPGQTQRGTLGDGDAILSRGNYYEVWTYRGPPGQRVTISAASDAFDTRVAWAHMIGGEPIPMLEDDDGGEGTNSELTVEVEEDGAFAVMISAMGPGQTGAYTVRVQAARR
jgi:hypothetical protein